MYPVSGASKDYYTLLVVPPGRRSLFYKIDGSDMNSQHLDSVKDSKLVCTTGMLNVLDVARRIEASTKSFKVKPRTLGLDVGGSVQLGACELHSECTFVATRARIV